MFKSIEDKKQAIDFLLAMKLPFTGILHKPFVSISANNYKRNDLDLYLPEHIGLTSFNYKTI